MIKIRREQIAGMNMHYKYRTLDYFFKNAAGSRNKKYRVLVCKTAFPAR